MSGWPPLTMTTGGLASTLPARRDRRLTAAAGFRCTAKDMRTWGATTPVIQQLAEASGKDGKPNDRILEAIDSAAEALGNTRAVCRASYVHPEIPEAYLDGRFTEAWEKSRRGTWLSRAESAVRKLLENERT